MVCWAGSLGPSGIIDTGTDGVLGGQPWTIRDLVPSGIEYPKLRMHLCAGDGFQTYAARPSALGLARPDNGGPQGFLSPTWFKRTQTDQLTKDIPVVPSGQGTGSPQHGLAETCNMGLHIGPNQTLWYPGTDTPAKKGAV